MGTHVGDDGVRPLWSAHAPTALVTLVLVAACDQLSKLWLLFSFRIADNQPVTLTPFFDVILVWNKGVSYGLLPLEGAGGQWILALIQLTIAAGLWLWLVGHTTALTRFALALIIGGAIGNAIDRVVHGAVADFFLLHLRALGSELSWYVFNLADIAIVAGVLGLLYESLVVDRLSQS